jgi:riboflavin biosynthesis pyrimidine reductase
VDIVLAGQLRRRAGDAGRVPPHPALQPALILECLYEAPGLQSFDFPRRLADLYDGSIGFPDSCLYANFVASLDGVVAGAGITSGTVSLGSAADRFVMGLLRAVASAVLIGAGTLRPDPGHRWTAEKIYPQAAAEFGALRASLKLAPEPPLAVVTASGRLPPVLTALTPGSLVITTPAGARALAGALPPVAELVVPPGAQDDWIPPAAIMATLHERGYHRVLTEGGPRLFGDLMAEGLVNEVFLTTSPALFGGAPPAIGITGRLAPAREPLARAQLLSLRRSGSHLLARYALGRSPSPEPALERPDR